MILLLKEKSKKTSLSVQMTIPKIEQCGGMQNQRIGDPPPYPKSSASSSQRQETRYYSISIYIPDSWGAD